MPDISLDNIIIGVRRRQHQIEKDAALAESIAESGLLQPIVVRPNTDGTYTLVAGLHRVGAFRKLNRTTIPATVLSNLDSIHAELAEIDENLIRNELQPWERMEHLKRRQEIYHDLHPDATPEAKLQAGGRKSAARTNQQRWDYRGSSSADSAELDAETPTFVQDTARKTGRSKRSIQEDIAISDSIAADVKASIPDTLNAMTKTALMKFANMAKHDQRDIAQRIVNGTATNVASAEKLRREEWKVAKVENERASDERLRTDEQARRLDRMQRLLALEKVALALRPALRTYHRVLTDTAPHIDRPTGPLEATLRELSILLANAHTDTDHCVNGTLPDGITQLRRS